MSMNNPGRDTAQPLLEPITDDEGALRAIYGEFPTGVTAVCALVGGVPAGIAASSFVPVSLAPPLVSVCAQHTSATWPLLRAAPRLGISVLAEGQRVQCQSLGTKTGNRFGQVRWVASDGGAVFVHGATAWFDCVITAEVPAGDHSIVLLEVAAVRAVGESSPLVFHRSRFCRLNAAVDREG
ncbi:flavin reductase family protein [Nocardia sp. CA-129566]|uniref:flavin reductase family protein n=1 Tax=Nocardia sp. CA-129566 TaxID=3239976 RepID=UPI003D988F4A